MHGAPPEQALWPSRRRMLAAGASLAWAPSARAESDQGAPIPFVDAHAHLNDPALQIELMDRYGAEQAVVFWGGRSDHDSLRDAADRWPGRLIPFASISPERRAYRGGWQAEDAATLVAALDAVLEDRRFRGIGEVSPVHFPSPGFPEADFHPDGPVMRAILRLAQRRRLPVVLHVESTRLAEFESLLRAFADVAVIWAHGGYTPLFLARRLLERHPNLTYELSARTWPVHPRSPEYTLLRDGLAVWPPWLELIEAQPGRFIVGTDASGRDRGLDQMKFASVQNLLRQLGPAARQRVAQGNLRALLG